MPLNMDPAPQLDGLPQALQRAARLAPDLRRGAGMTLVGPLRSFTAEPGAFARGATAASVRAGGWRGLVVAADDPVALVDIHEAASSGRAPRYSVRTGEAAAAFARALEAAQAFEKRHPGVYGVRFLAFPGIFLTAVWLFGPRTAFIPTRIGASARPAPQSYDRRAFVRLVARRWRKIIRDHARAPAVAGRAPSGLVIHRRSDRA